MAGVLAKSFRKFHPEADFILILCDRIDDYPVERYIDCTEIIEFSELGIPDFETFVYKYSLMELNTATKAFAFEFLFRSRRYDQIVYMDPDIWVHRPMVEAFSALDTADIVLTPHLRRPYFDNANPSDLNIVQSGTYNLGFLGLRRGQVADQFLSWWAEKLHADCVVAIPRGLFVDQKWIDLVPGFFPSHRILYDPTYNVAYWNLHERQLEVAETGGFLVDDEPLAFFHFSGLSPFEPSRLSKHQNRITLRWEPALRKLCNAYIDAVLRNGFETTCDWPFSYGTLANGIRLPLRLAACVVDWAVREQVAVPDPLTEPDRFCRFLMHKQDGMPVLLRFLLNTRPEILKAFPKAREYGEDFRKWLLDTGANEAHLVHLLKFDAETHDDAVASTFALLRENKRDDIFKKFARMWRHPAVFMEFAGWLDEHGVSELGIAKSDVEELRESYQRIGNILDIYFSRTDLQKRFTVLEREKVCDQFGIWLTNSGHSRNDVALFKGFVAASPVLIGRMRFLYQHCGLPRTPGSIFLLEERLREMREPPSSESVARWLLRTRSPGIHDQYRVAVDRGMRSPTFDAVGIPDIDVPLATPREALRLAREIGRGNSGSESEIGINLATFGEVATGMGELGRSLHKTLVDMGAAVHHCRLPHELANSPTPIRPAFLGLPSTTSRTSITVANADTSNLARLSLASYFWTRTNIGYWMWETEVLPRKFEGEADLYSEVWTASEFSAAAIRATIDKEVAVIPIALDLPGISAARGDRARFGLPEDGLLFGFMFDPNSIMERKNLRGLIEAFCAAFTERENAYLVIKINGRFRRPFEYSWIKARTQSGRILFLEETLSRPDVFDFMASLDVYVSLHRSEGFGLTCAEAMAMAKPVIATGYSGNLDFMTKDNSLLVPARVITTDRTYDAYPAGSRWGDPDLEAAAQSMRRMLDGEFRTALGNTAKADVSARLNGDAVARLIAQRLETA